MSLKRSTLLLMSSGPAFGARAQGESGGLLENSQWSLLNRMLYDQRAYRHGGCNGAARNANKPRGERSGYAQEWAYGLMGSLQSGFTCGTIGMGLDAQGVLLDSGGGRADKAPAFVRASPVSVLDVYRPIADTNAGVKTEFLAHVKTLNLERVVKRS